MSAALKLFSEKGYGSASVADILREADANAGSLYHVFPTKQDLLLAVTAPWIGHGIGPMLLDPAWAGVEDPIERVFALLARYRLGLEVTDCAYGCPIGSLALELHEPDPPVRTLLALNFEAWVDAVRRCLDSAADRLPPSVDRQALAQFVLSVMEGGVMQSRTHRSLAPFDAGIACLRAYFDRLALADDTETGGPK